MSMKRSLVCSGLLAAVVGLSACDLSPDYAPPPVTQPQAFKETGTWVAAQPADVVERGAWWKVFNEAQLNALEDQVTVSNENLKAALAAYDQAKFLAASARTAYFPVITGSSSAMRQRMTEGLPNKSPVSTYNNFAVGADMAYEVDIWGRVRNTVKANEAQAQATAADVAGMALSLHAELADDYFALRGDDENQAILDSAVIDFQKALDLTRQRYKGGVSAEYDVDEAETQLQNAKTQAAENRLQRASLEHAIAVLVGKSPSEFTLPPAKLDARLPLLAPGLPSQLLERRPDIAAAERRTEAANAEIGVARAAYFPTFNLEGEVGYEASSIGNWLSAPSLFWAVGPESAMTLFDAGNISDLTDAAKAVYEQNAASYRQTVLGAYQEVEDNLAALHHLADEDKTQSLATRAADRALQQANNRYVGGTATYLDVIVTQSQDLQAKIAQVNVATRRLSASVQLIRALGGGWDSSLVRQASDPKPNP